MVARKRLRKITGEPAPKDRYANVVSPAVTNWLGAFSARVICAVPGRDPKKVPARASATRIRSRSFVRCMTCLLRVIDERGTPDRHALAAEVDGGRVAAADHHPDPLVRRRLIR